MTGAGAWRVVLIGLCLAAAVIRPSAAPAATAVKVGVYEFPPYVTAEGGGVTRGFAELLNKEQADFRFTLVTTSPQRRYADLEQGRYDVIAFESVNWGWAGKPVDASRVFFRDGEVFVARAAPGVDQRYFDNLDGKSILGRLGYHYAYAGFDSSADVLRSRFNTQVTVTHEGNVLNVVNGRADLAIVTKSFLVQFLKTIPGEANRLIVSDRYDQVYEHTILARRGGPITVERINALLDRLESSGRLAELWKQYGIVQ